MCDTVILAKIPGWGSCRLATLTLVNNCVVKLPPDIFLYTHRLGLLSTQVRETSVCIRQQSLLTYTPSPKQDILISSLPMAQGTSEKKQKGWSRWMMSRSAEKPCFLDTAWLSSSWTLGSSGHLPKTCTRASSLLSAQMKRCSLDPIPQ